MFSVRGNLLLKARQICIIFDHTFARTSFFDMYFVAFFPSFRCTASSDEPHWRMWDYILRQAWPTRSSRAACGSLPGFMLLSRKYRIYSYTSRKIL